MKRVLSIRSFLAESFLSSRYMDGIPIGEIKESSEKTLGGESDDEFTLTVFSRMLS